MMDTPLFQIQSPYDLPKLKLLPLREQPAYRVAQNAGACNLAELLAAIVGGQNQIEIAEDLLKRFGGLRGLYQAHTANCVRPKIGSVKGIGPQTAARLKAALALGKRCSSPQLNQGNEEHPRIETLFVSTNCPADAAALVHGVAEQRTEMRFLKQELSTPGAAAWLQHKYLPLLCAPRGILPMPG